MQHHLHALQLPGLFVLKSYVSSAAAAAEAAAAAANGTPCDWLTCCPAQALLRGGLQGRAANLLQARSSQEHLLGSAQ
jgi:hypothetical protein